jgi:hypothetical protein
MMPEDGEVGERLVRGIASGGRTIDQATFDTRVERAAARVPTHGTW